MKHTNIDKENIIERYLMHDLSDAEEDAFEEHLISCRICREKLKKTEVIIENLKKSETNKVFDTKPDKIDFISSGKRNYSFLKIAAGILLVIGSTGLYLLLHERHNAGNEIPVADNKNVADSLPQKIDRQADPEKSQEKKQNKDKSPVILAENFVPDAFYENLVENVYRSESLHILSPGNDTLSAEPVFDWKYANEDSLKLIIVNNKKARIFDMKIKKPYRLNIKLSPGLYYWQLQTEEETLVTKRMVIK